MNFKGIFPIVLFSLIFIATALTTANRSAPGSLSGLKSPTAEVQGVVNAVKVDVEIAMGRDFATFNVVAYKTQVVAGTNYFVKVDVGGANFIHLRIYKPLPHMGQQPSLVSYTRGHTATSEIVFF